MRDIISKSAVLLCLFFMLAGSIVSVNRYWQYEVFFYDFGIFDQAIWKVSRFTPPIIDHLVVSGKWIFADHFNPSIFIFSPLFWLTDKSEILLIAQSVFVGISGVVIYLLGRKVTKNNFFSLSIVVCYLFFIGLQNAIISDFHEVTVMVLPLSITFWAIIQRKIRLYILFLLITLGFKESTFLLGIGIGFFILIAERKWWKIGIGTILASIIYGIITIKFVIPYFSGGFYQYTPTLQDGIVTNIQGFFDSGIKQRTIFYSFFSFGFLPLFAPSFWPLFLQDFASRFLPQFSGSRWDLGLHYSAQISPLLAISSFYSFRFLQKFKNIKAHNTLLSITLIIIAMYLYHFVFHGPLALVYNPAFYAHTKDFTFLDKLIEKVPHDVKVMAQNNLATRFTHQPVWLLRDSFGTYSPDYIVADVRSGQNPNNYFGMHDFYGIVNELKQDPEYETVYQTKEQFIFKRKK